MHVLFDANDQVIDVHPGHWFSKAIHPPSQDALRFHGAAYCMHISKCSREQYESAVRRGTRALMHRIAATGQEEQL